MTRVFHLSTGAEITYSCSPKDAVIAAYAQSLGDYNTWQYQEKYGARVRLANGRTWSLGDFAAIDRS
jgi:hypothetical protein